MGRRSWVLALGRVLGVVIANALHARDLRLEVYELPDESPIVVLTLDAHDHEEGYRAFHAYVLELDLETFARFADGLAQIAAVLGHRYRPL